MLRCALVIAVLVALGPGAASAADSAVQTTTWDTAAVTARYPVYRPAQTLGLRSHGVSVSPCSAAPGRQVWVTAAYGNAASRTAPSFWVGESPPTGCGNDGEAKPVRHVVRDGINMYISVNCRDVRCGVTEKDGYANGFQLYLHEPGPRRTSIEVSSHHLSVTRLIAVAASLRRVRTDGPLVEVAGFRTPDGNTWCTLTRVSYADEAYCATRTPERSVLLKRDGSATICDRAVDGPGCVQNWDDDATKLKVGQTSEFAGYRCAVALDGTTCTVSDPGPGQGKGFHIAGAGITPVGP